MFRIYRAFLNIRVVLFGYISKRKEKNNLDGDFWKSVLYIYTYTYFFLPFSLIRISGFDVKYSFILGNVPFKF